MSETLQARIEAMRLAMEMAGSIKDKLKAAELIHEFLEKGVYHPPLYNYASAITYTPPTNYSVTSTQTANG